MAGSHWLYSLVYRCTLSSSDLERSVPGVVKGSTRRHGTCQFQQRKAVRRDNRKGLGCTVVLAW